MIAEINAEHEKSDRLTVAKLNTVKQYIKQDHKSKLMTERKIFVITIKSSTINTSIDIQRMSEKHPDFEIEPVNTI